MTEENTLNTEESLGFGSETTEKPRRRKRSTKATKVEEPMVEETELKEPAEEPAPKPVIEEPTPVAKPWKPLVRPMKKKSGNNGPNRGEMRRAR